MWRLRGEAGDPRPAAGEGKRRAVLFLRAATGCAHHLDTWPAQHIAHPIAVLGHGSSLLLWIVARPLIYKLNARSIARP